MFEGRVVTLGVTSGIACYKAVDLMRDLQRHGARVRVVMTRSAAELVRPALFEALSGERVGVALWSDWPDSDEAGRYAKFPHLDYVRDVDAVVVAPATVHTMARAALGLGDDLLSTMLLAVDPGRTPVLFVPSMNATMYAHPATALHRATLLDRGYGVVTPDEGMLACGERGVGRWPGSEVVLAALDRMMNGKNRLAGRRVVVTAGRTESDLDPARTISNRSTGRMGFAVAEAVWREGAEVTLVHGPSALSPPPFVEAIEIRTPEEMGQAVRRALPGADQLWMTAAVGDWRATLPSPTKRKKSEWDGVLQLEPTEDILARAAVDRDPGTTLIGFAVETDDVVRRAEEKLAAKGCDYLVVNNPLDEGAGFGHDTNVVMVLGQDGSRVSFDRMTKRELAHRLVEHVLDHVGSAAPAGP